MVGAGQKEKEQKETCDSKLLMLHTYASISWKPHGSCTAANGLAIATPATRNGLYRVRYQGIGTQCPGGNAHIN
jgi:hypothetical protein